jgi:Ion channel
MTHVLAAIAAVLLIAAVLWDAFETVVLPRLVSRRFRLARAYFRSTWRAWSALARHWPVGARRETALAVYGPIALLALLALWVFLLIVGYGLLLWGLGSPLTANGSVPGGLGTDLYFSGTTFLTLGLGDVVPRGGPARAVAVFEVGTGFGILALVVGYLPVLYQAFSRREVRISLLDAHAGSPPTAGALLLRHPPRRRARRLQSVLAEWEGWSADLLETHLSYPLLAYYRSQHEDQSWVAALTIILDACALVLASEPQLLDDEELAEQAGFTFAMARHAAVDLAQIFGTRRGGEAAERLLSPDEHGRLTELLREAQVLPPGDAGRKPDGRLHELRALYEPYLAGLGDYLLMPLPPWAPEADRLDDWQTTADGVTAPSLARLLSDRATGSPGRPA